jgi:conjugal transfer pilus assembly protein TraF
MVKRVLIFVFVFLLSFTLISAYAEQKIPVMDPALEEGKPYYSDIKRGWWWYEKAPEKEKKAEVPTLRGERKSEKPEKRILPSLKDYTYGQLWNMHPDDFQPLLMDFQKKAVMSPTEENVRDYYVIQDIARRKSLAFANVASYVVQKYPGLYVGKDYPVATPGRNALVRQQLEEIEGVIRSGENDFALLYFYSPTCPYCTEQQEILRYFVKKYNWQVKRIDINENPQLEQRFGITITPSLLLIYKGSQDYIPVSSGVASMAEIEEKIYRGMRLLKGEITPEEYSLYEFQRGGSFDVKTPSVPFEAPLLLGK